MTKDIFHIFNQNEESWNGILERVTQYIEKNDKRPARSDKCKDIQQLGNWIKCQQQNYNNKNNNMSDPNICNKWKEFVDKYKKHFMTNE
jgi:hypothetical protein